MDGLSPELPELAPALTRPGEPFEIANVHVHRLRRSRQACGDRGVDDPAACPVQPVLQRTGLRTKVRLAERDAADGRVRGDRRTPPRTRGDSIIACTGRSGMASGRSTFGMMTPASGSAATAARSSSSRGFTRTKTGFSRGAASSATTFTRASFLLPTGTRVLEVDDHRVCARGDRLLDSVGPVGGNEEPGQRRRAQTTPPRRSCATGPQPSGGSCRPSRCDQ